MIVTVIKIIKNYLFGKIFDYEERVGFFLYSEKIAGVENYLVNLINSWPEKNDIIIIFINKNFKSINKLKQKFRRKVIFFFTMTFSNIVF